MSVFRTSKSLRSLRISRVAGHSSARDQGAAKAAENTKWYSRTKFASAFSAAPVTAARSCCAFCLFHPNVELVFVTANEQAGKPVGEVHRNLNGLTKLNFIAAPEESSSRMSTAFSSRSRTDRRWTSFRACPENVKAIDLSGDFRLRDQSVFEKHYKQPHTAMSSQAGVCLRSD